MPPKLKSQVWKYFCKVDSTSAECKLCGKRLKTSGNTSNLKGHMQVHQKQLNSSENLEADVTEPEIPSKRRCIENYLNEHEPRPSMSKESVSPTLQVEIDQTAVQVHTPSSSEPEQGSQKSNDIDKSGNLQVGKDLCTSLVRKNSVSGTEQPKLKKIFQNIANFEEGGKQYTRITKALIYFICKDNMPLNIVEGTGFKKFIKEISPLYKTPCRNTIKKRIIDKYEGVSHLFKEKLSKIKSLVITSDIWTETMQMKSFLGITIHFLEGTTMVAGCLDVIELSESHTGEYICSTLHNVLKAWNINVESVTAIVTDNDAKMLKAVGKLVGMGKHLSCFAHTINLTVENAIKFSGVEELFTKIRTIVNFFKCSTNASDDLRKAQLKEGLLEGQVKKLILDVSTRWNSKYYMCLRFLELMTIVSNILLTRPNSPPMLSANEVELLKEAIRLLQIMEKLTVEVSGEQYVTISIVIPLINCITKNFTSVNVTHPLAISLKEALLKEIEKRFGTREQVHLLALGTFFDPRFKNVHFNNPLASAKVLQKVNTMILSEQMNDETESTSINSLESVDIVSEDQVDIWGFQRDLTQKQNVKIKEVQNSDSINPAIKMYLSAPLSNLKENPLEIWEDLKKVYPSLYPLARQHLGIVCTSVPSERLFSRAGDIISAERNRISGKLLPKLLFLNSLPEKFW